MGTVEMLIIGGRARIVVALCAIGGSLVLCGVASAATIKVSPGGTNSGTCGVNVAPDCRTVKQAVVTRAVAGDTVSIAPGTYAESDIVAAKNVSIVATGPGVILRNADPATPALHLTSTARVTLSGLTFRSSVAQQVAELRTTGPVDVSDVVFDSPEVLTPVTGAKNWQAMLFVGTGGAPTLTGATFAGKSNGGGAVFVSASPGSNATVANVTVGGGYVGQGNESVVLEDTVASGLEVTGTVGRSVRLSRSATLTDSRIHDEDTGTPSTAVYSTRFGQNTVAALARVAVRRNVITGASFGIQVFDGEAITEGNVVGAPQGTALVVSSGLSQTVDSTHDTFSGLQGAAVGQQGMLTLHGTWVARIAAAAGRCTSQGSAGVPIGEETCGITTVAGDPGFVDAAGGDFHLKPDSPLIDLGIAADPSTAELDGGPRTLDGNADGIARSDAGYDEYVPTPDTFIDSGPGATQPGQTATFTFSSTTAQTTFSCVVDGGTPVACDAGTLSVSGLAAGDHTFSVAASIAGSTDPSPARTAFTLRVQPPDTTPSPGGTTSPPGVSRPPTGRPAAPVLSKARLTASRVRAGRVPRALAVRFSVSAPASVTVRLDRLLAKKRAKRVGKVKTVTRTSAGAATLKLRGLAPRLAKGRYRLTLGLGSRTVKTLTLVVT